MSRRSAGELPAEPWILGLACSHNGAACLLRGDELVVAVQEERLSRRKRHRLHAGRASLAVRYCLEAAGIGPGDLDLVVAAVQGSREAPRENLLDQPDLRLAEHGTRHRVVPHHLAHAASAAALAAWDETAVLVLDGLGSPAADLGPAEQAAVATGAGDGWEIASLYRARGWGGGASSTGAGPRLEPLEKHLVPGGAWLGGDPRRMRTFGSLGGLYAAASWQLFGDHRQAGKVMGLAALGEPEIPVERFFRIGEAGELVFSDAVPAAWPPGDDWATAPGRAAALAASVQRALEEGVLHHARRLRALSGCRRLAYAGGVALNGPANERIAAEAGFEELFVVPAAEDSGTAVGAAYLGLAELAREGSARAGAAPRPGRRERSPLARDETGRRYPAAEIDAALAAVPGVVSRQLSDRRELLDAVVEQLVAGEAIGWLRGGSELGPRALGQRSLLADPRPAAAKERLNRRVKRREPFRPFAPAVLLEAVGDWFEPAPGDPASPFMLRVRRFRTDRPHPVPAVVHADGTGRLQTLDGESGPLRDLVAAFGERTGVPLLLNTSFNGPGEPIVETPEDALWCLLATGLDACVLEDRLVGKAPGVASLLDLVPRRTSAGHELHRPGGDGEPFVVFQAITRWGTTPRYFGRGALAVLAAVDGRRDGRALLARFVAPKAASRTGGGRSSIVDTLDRWNRHAGPDGHLPGGHSPVEVVETLAAEGVAADGTVAGEGSFVRLLARLREAGALRFERAATR